MEDGTIAVILLSLLITIFMIWVCFPKKSSTVENENY